MGLVPFLAVSAAWAERESSANPFRCFGGTRRERLEPTCHGTAATLGERLRNTDPSHQHLRTVYDWRSYRQMKVSARDRFMPSRLRRYGRGSWGWTEEYQGQRAIRGDGHWSLSIRRRGFMDSPPGGHDVSRPRVLRESRTVYRHMGYRIYTGHDLVLLPFWFPTQEHRHGGDMDQYPSRRGTARSSKHQSSRTMPRCLWRYTMGGNFQRNECQPEPWKNME